MRRLVWSLVIWISLASTANSQKVPEDYNAEHMLDLCNGEVPDGEKGMQSMVCTFRMQGIIYMMVENCMSIAHGFKPLPLFTSERPPSRGAARQAFVNFMNANPDKWGLPWHHAVSMALSKNFPCKR